MKKINTLYWENAEFLSGTEGGKHTYHCALIYKCFKAYNERGVQSGRKIDEWESQRRIESEFIGGGGYKEGHLLEGSQASIAPPFDLSFIKIKTLIFGEFVD